MPKPPILVAHRCTCGAAIEVATPMQGATVAQPGDVVICLECTRAWQFGDAMQLLAVDVDQLEPQGRQQIRQTQAAVGALRASGRSDRAVEEGSTGKAACPRRSHSAH